MNRADRERGDVRKLADAVRSAGPDGLTRQQLTEVALMGKERFARAEQLLSASAAVTTSKEVRPDQRGHSRQQVVFRHRAAKATGTVPARVSRDPAVRATLNELELIQEVAKARATGRRTPRAIARWILSQPSVDASVWVDVEGLLAERVAALD
jgi:hypothetical protein